MLTAHSAVNDLVDAKEPMQDKVQRSTIKNFIDQFKPTDIGASAKFAFLRSSQKATFNDYFKHYVGQNNFVNAGDMFSADLFQLILLHRVYFPMMKALMGKIHSNWCL